MIEVIPTWAWVVWGAMLYLVIGAALAYVLAYDKRPSYDEEMPCLEEVMLFLFWPFIGALCVLSAPFVLPVIAYKWLTNRPEES